MPAWEHPVGMGVPHPVWGVDGEGTHWARGGGSLTMAGMLMRGAQWGWGVSLSLPIPAARLCPQVTAWWPQGGRTGQGNS